MASWVVERRKAPFLPCSYWEVFSLAHSFLHTYPVHTHHIPAPATHNTSQHTQQYIQHTHHKMCTTLHHLTVQHITTHTTYTIQQTSQYSISERIQLTHNNACIISQDIHHIISQHNTCNTQHKHITTYTSHHSTAHHNIHITYTSHYKTYTLYTHYNIHTAIYTTSTSQHSTQKYNLSQQSRRNVNKL